jgi:hypothetical protein
MTDRPFQFPVFGTAPNEFTEVGAFSDAQNRAVGAASAQTQFRPGEFPERYTSILNGNRNGAAPAGVVATVANIGKVRAVTGAGIIALRDRLSIADNEIVFWARYRRTVNPTDPSGDTVRFRVQWLDLNYASISQTTILSNNLTVAMGTQIVQARLGGTEATISAPAGTAYAVPYIETFGTDGVTQVLALGAATDPLAFLEEPLPQVFIPEFPVARTFYVTMDGNNANSGTSLSKPLATIAAAMAKMTAEAPDPCVTIVHPGEYLVPRDTEIPDNCAIYGYDVRVTKFILANAAGNAPATSDADRRQNMFLMNNGIKVRGITFVGMRHEPYTFDISGDSFTPPEKGWAFVFKPGATITRSPYIADCTYIHDFTQDQLLLPVDRAAGNPLMPVGGGNLYADGSVLNPNSPLRSVVVDGFTGVNPNGIGYCITRNAIVQLVSVFTNWSRVGIWTHEGGQVTLANSNNTFGDYAFASTGFRAAIRITGTVDDVAVHTTTGADLIDANLSAILANLYTAPSSGLFTARAGWGALTNQQKDFAIRDAETLIRAISRDFRSGQDRGTQYFIKGLFDWNAEFVFNPTLKTLFLETFDDIETAIRVYVVNAGARTMLANLIALVKDVIDTGDQALGTSPYKVAFPSVIEATGQQFSYSGAGVNYNSLPFSQRGTSEPVDPALTILEADGGAVFATFATESGDTYLGKDLRVDFRRSTIEGQAFERGVQATTLPLIIALGG